MAGRVSKRIIEKLCQYVKTLEKSENIKDENCKNPDELKSADTAVKEGISPATEAINITEKIKSLLKTKRRSSL